MTATPHAAGDVIASADYNLLAANFGAGWDISATATSTAITGGTLFGQGPLGRGNQDYWQATAIGQQIDIAFAASHTFWGVAFGTYFRNDTRYIPTAVAIDLSPDNVTWTNVATITGNTSPVISFFLNVRGSLPSFQALRLTINGFSTGGYANIAGLQVFALDWAAGFGGNPFLVDANGLPLSRSLAGADGHVPLLIASGTLWNAATVSFQNIPSGFSHLRIAGSANTNASVYNTGLYLRFNNDASASYTAHGVLSQGTSVSATDIATATTLGQIGEVSGASLTNDLATFAIDIPGYAAATPHYALGHANCSNDSGTGRKLESWAVKYAGTAAINRIDLLLGSGVGLTNNTPISLYGYL